VKELVGQVVSLWRNPRPGEEHLNPDGERVFFNDKSFVSILDYSDGFIKVEDNGFTRWLNVSQFRTIEVV
jgi:hypothetical protein